LRRVLDPGKGPFSDRDPRSTEERVEALGELFLDPHLGIKFLVVWWPGSKDKAGTHGELRRLLDKRYPRVVREPSQPYGQLRGFPQREVYYVGGELSHRDLSRLLSEAEQPQARACNTGVREFQLEKRQLEDAWAEFGTRSAQWEREKAEFSAAQDLIESVDLLRCRP